MKKFYPTNLIKMTKIEKKKIASAQNEKKSFIYNKDMNQNPTAGWTAVPSGSGRLSLFRTIETWRNRTEPAVNRWLGFEAVPYRTLHIFPSWDDSKRARGGR